MFFNTKFILASKSQSRSFILKNNKLSFLQVEPKCNEDRVKKIFKKSKPKKLSLILAESKAKSLSTINRSRHLVLLAMNETGLQNIFKLVSLIHLT